MRYSCLNDVREIHLFALKKKQARYIWPKNMKCSSKKLLVCIQLLTMVTLWHDMFCSYSELLAERKNQQNLLAAEYTIPHY